MEVMRHASTFLLPYSSPPTGDGPALNYALVVLNQRLPRYAPLLWSRAQLRVCADGGANRIYDGMPELFPDQDPLNVRLRYKPDVIKGDMDSIRADVKEFYSNLSYAWNAYDVITMRSFAAADSQFFVYKGIKFKEVKIVDESHDQDTTDLHKCIAFICNSIPDPEKSNVKVSYKNKLLEVKHRFFKPLDLCILVAGALGGRFDHEVGNINVLYRFSNIRIILLSDDCLIYLLPKTHRHEIHIQSSVEGPHCGLIPAGAPSTSTTTTGLQWDLADMGMSFGGLISTSNIVRGAKVTVESDSDLLWTISIRRTN